VANRLYGGLAGKGGSKTSGGTQGGKAQSMAMPIKTANWPSLPGPGGPDRSGGTPKVGYCGAPFYVKAAFSPMKMGKKYGGKAEDMMSEMHKKMK